jgi:hypothetical protein
MLKFGLEKELFILKEGVVQVVPKEIPYDESGLLIEARGQPYNDITEAVFSLEADIYRITKKAEEMGFEVSDKPIMPVSRKIKLEASRKFAKGLTKYENLYNFERHLNGQNQHTAGVHISFTSERNITCDKCNLNKQTINEMFDFVWIFKKLDQAFIEEIKYARRRPGFYEIKPNGRIEYRSLPSNVHLSKIIEVIGNIKEERKWKEI